MGEKFKNYYFLDHTHLHCNNLWHLKHVKESELCRVRRKKSEGQSWEGRIRGEGRQRDPQLGVRPGKKAEGKFPWLAWRFNKNRVKIKYWTLLGIADSSGLYVIFTLSFDSMTIKFWGPCLLYQAGEGNTNCVFGSICPPGWGKFQMFLVLTSETASFLSWGRSVGRRHQRCVGVSHPISSFPSVSQMDIPDITGLVSPSGKSTLLKPLDFLQNSRNSGRLGKQLPLLLGDWREGKLELRAPCLG